MVKVLMLKNSSGPDGPALAGKEVEVSPKEAEALVKDAAARYVEKPAEKKKSEADDELQELRTQADDLGIVIDGRWKAEKLRLVIAEALDDEDEEENED